MATERLPRRMLISEAGKDRGIGRDGQPVTWKEIARNITSERTRVGEVEPAGWGAPNPRREGSCWCVWHTSLNLGF